MMSRSVMPFSPASRRRRWRWPVLLVTLSGICAAAPASRGQEQPVATFGERIDVHLATFVVRVIDRHGEPVAGLGPDNFAVTLDDRPIRVVAVDRVSSKDTGPPASAGQAPGGRSTQSGDEPAAATPPVGAPGKRIVLFVQADFNALRIHGHLKMLPFVRKLLDSLAPRDEVALVSFDSHLKLWQDFTTDRDAVADAVYQAVRFGNDPPPAAWSRAHRHVHAPAAGGASVPSLARGLDPRAAKDAPYAEKGLELVGDALAPLSGEKAIVFLGWGLGRYGFGGFRPRHGYWRPAVEALGRANVTVFVLDVTDAASHTLELGLRQVAAATGGTYDKTAVFPIQATHRLARLLSSYYLLTVDASAARAGEVDVQLVGMKPGLRVLMRPLTAVPEAEASGG